jgi:hypothetical protein
MVTEFEIKNQQIAIAHNELLAQLARAIDRLTGAINNSK